MMMCRVIDHDGGGDGEFVMMIATGLVSLKLMLAINFRDNAIMRMATEEEDGMVICLYFHQKEHH